MTWRFPPVPPLVEPMPEPPALRPAEWKILRDPSPSELRMARDDGWELTSALTLEGGGRSVALTRPLRWET